MRIWLSREASKFLDKVDEQTINRFDLAFQKLLKQPPEGDIKPVKGSEALRLRIGKYRVIYYLEGDIIKITDIDSRGQIYKRKR